MEYRDYYATLGVPRTAGAAEIKKAFRRLARKHHPDVNKSDPAAEARFKEASEAYDVLSDPKKRGLYDQLGANWESYQRSGSEAGQAGPFGGRADGGSPGGVRFEYHGSPEDLAGFSDFFRTFFAGGVASDAGGVGRTGPAGTTRASATAGSTGRFRGATIEEILGGFRGAGGDEPIRGPDAQADVEVTLEEAFHGTQRRVEVDGRRLEVRIPRGVASGQRIRLSGRAGARSDAGDLYLRVTVRVHPVYGRDGEELRRELPITLGEALLGAEVPVTTLKGRVLLTIPPGTQQGRTFRLKGQGMPRFGASDDEAPTGDLLAKVTVVLPGSLNAEAREAATRLTELLKQPDPRS